MWYFPAEIIRDHQGSTLPFPPPLPSYQGRVICVHRAMQGQCRKKGQHQQILKGQCRRFRVFEGGYWKDFKNLVILKLWVWFFHQIRNKKNWKTISACTESTYLLLKAFKKYSSRDTIPITQQMIIRQLAVGGKSNEAHRFTSERWFWSKYRSHCTVFGNFLFQRTTHFLKT